jgi:hypothetical protein
MNIKKIFELSLLLLSAVASGCFTSTLVTPTGTNGGLSYTQFNEKIGNDKVTVVLRLGEKIEAKSLYIRPDTLSWVLQQSQVRREMPIDSLYQVVNTDHGIGALVGLGIGGVTVAGILFAVTRDVTGESGEFVGPGILIGGGGAALLGGIIGGLNGWRHRYEFSNDTQDKNAEERGK